MLDDAKEHFDIKRRECKDLRKELKALKQTFDELNVSHERCWNLLTYHLFK